MLSRFLLKAAITGLVLGLLAVAGSAQPTHLKGTIKLKNPDGTKKPVPNAVIDIYRTDIKGKYDVKSDKNGHFVRLGLPVQGTFMFVVSAPGCRPEFQNN